MFKKTKWAFLFFYFFLVADYGYSFAIPHKCKTNGMFALTLDDGVSKNYDITLSILKQEKVKATFFVVGETLVAPKNIQRLKQAYADGHLIANHTWNHYDLTSLGEEEIKKEILSAQNAICQNIPLETKYIRTPYGSINNRVFSILTTMGYTPVYWNIDAKDWKRSSTQILATYKKIFLNADPTKTSFISVLHDRRKETIAVLPEIIQLVKSKGFSFVRISECI